MSIEFTCPKCNQHYSVENDLADQKARCEACGTKFLVPAASEQVTVADANLPGPDVLTLKSSADHAQPPAIAPTLDADIQRGGVTITQFMARHGIEGGVRLQETDEKKPSTSRASDVLTDEQGRKYRVGKVVAKGGMGAILSVKDLNVRRTVAMKVMLNPEKVTEQQVLRFIEEAQVTGQLEHPGIVPVYELGVDAGENVFYTMKLLHGTTLKDILEGIAEHKPSVVQQYPLSRLLTVFQKVCDAMAFAHARGVIHRDLKPENIMVGDFGEVLVLDWGLAKVLGGDRQEAAAAQPPAEIESARLEAAASGDSESLRTLEGQVMGTPSYMAPEQALGKIEQLGPQTDIYALGGILYTMLTLRPPVSGRNIGQVLLKVAKGEIVPPTEVAKSAGGSQPRKPRTPASPVDLQKRAAAAALKAHAATADGKESPFPHLPGGAVPAPLSAIAMKALALDPVSRYQVVQELQADIERYQTGFATSAEEAGLARQLVLLVRRHRGFVTAAALLFLAVSIGLVVSVSQWRKAVAEGKRASDNERTALAAKAQAEANEKRAASSEREANASRAEAELAGYRMALELAARYLSENKPQQARELLAACPKELRHWEWGYLTCQARKEEAWRSGHWGSTATMSKDNHLLAVGGMAGVTVVDAGTGAERFKLNTDSAKLLPCQSLNFTPDGTKLGVLYGGPNGGSFQVYDLPAGKLLLDHKDSFSYGGSVAVSSDGNLALVSKGRDRPEAMMLWDLRAMKVLRSIGAAEPHMRVDWSPDGTAAVVAQERDIELYETTNWRCLCRIAAHRGRVSDLRFFPDSMRFVSCCADDRTVKVWAMPAGTPVLTLAGGEKGVNCVRVSASGKYILGGMGRPDSEFAVWGADDGRLVANLPLPGDGISDIAEDPHRSTVWVCDNGGGKVARLDLSRVMAGSLLDRIIPLPTSRGKLSLNRTKGVLVAGGSSASLSPDGRVGAFTGAASGDFYDSAVSPSGNTFAAGMWDKTPVSVWETGTGRVLRKFPGTDARPVGFGVSVCFLDDRRLATGEQATGKVWVWDIASGQKLRELDTGTHVFDLELSPNGRALLACARHPLIWNTETWESETWSEPKGPSFMNARFSPDGASLALIGFGGTLQLWRVRDRVLVSQCSAAHTGRSDAGIAFSPDGSRFVTGGADGRLVVWNGRTGERIVSLSSPFGMDGNVFSPDGRTLFSLHSGSILIREADRWE